MVAQYIILILEAGGVTLRLAFTSLIIATLIGLACALWKTKNNRIISGLVSGYTLLARGIPDLVMMLFVFYSLPALVNAGFERYGSDYTFEISPFVAGVATLGFILGAYMTGTFYNALINIARGELEAAQAYGFSRLQIFSAIILPQLIRLSLPGFTNNWLVLIKATALVSLLGLEDLMSRARSAAEATGQPFTFYLLAGAFYFVVSLLSVVILKYLTKKYASGIRVVKI